VHTATLLKGCDLSDRQAIETHLPADARCASRWRLRRVFLKTNVVVFGVDTQRAEAFQVELLHIHRRGLENDLKLRVLIEPIGILAIPTVGGPTTGLHESDTIVLRAEDTKERFRMHGAGSDLHVVRLLKNTALFHPKPREFQNQILKGEPRPLPFKLYFNFQALSNNSGVVKRRSVFNAIHAKAAARNSPALDGLDLSNEIRSSLSPVYLSASALASR